VKRISRRFVWKDSLGKDTQQGVFREGGEGKSKGRVRPGKRTHMRGVRPNVLGDQNSCLTRGKKGEGTSGGKGGE